MKAAVHASAKGVEHSRKDMLSAVTLHIVEASVPVYLKMHSVAGRKRSSAFHHVVYLPVVFVDFLYPKVVNVSGIAALTASGGKENGLVQDNQSAFFAGRHCENFGVGFFKIDVFFK